MKKLFYISLCIALFWGCESPDKPQQDSPVVSTKVESITENSAICYAIITPMALTKAAGIKYGTDPQLTNNTTDVGASITVEDYDYTNASLPFTLSNLQSDQKYYFKAYAIDNQGVIYSEAQSFTTLKNIALDVSTSLIEAGEVAGSYSFAITCNDSWTLSSDQSWCTVQPASGTGNASITVAVEANTTSTYRIAIITITAGNLSKQLTVKQKVLQQTGPLTWSYDNGVLTISGTGAMPNYVASSSPWYENRGNIKSVNIQNGITSIGAYAFYECSSLTSITIPNSVTTVGSRAFEDCSGLIFITIGSSVTTIGEGVFYFCADLKNVVVLSTTPPSIQSDAFIAVPLASATLTVPQGCKADYEAADGWKDFGTITEQ
jgi:hypothetical protein